MPFIKFADTKGKTRGLYQSGLHGLRASHIDCITFDGVDQSFVAVPLEALVVLDDLRIKYKEVREEEMKKMLLPTELSVYHHYVKCEPEKIYFNQKLPPAGYAEMIFRVKTEDVSKTQKLLFNDYDATVNYVRAMPSGNTFQLSCLIKRNRIPLLKKELMNYKDITLLGDNWNLFPEQKK